MGHPVRTSPNDEQLLLQLKDILLGKDRDDIAELQKTLNTPEELKKKVNPIFDEKIEDVKKNFPNEFGKLVDKAIEEKLEDSQRQILDVIYPVLGQMIRKYVTYQFQMLRDRLDEQVKNTFTIKNLIRRLKAKLFGIDETELILTDITAPVIEEIYIIQQDSGLLVGTYSRNNTIDQDMIAGMLTAIKSFVEDAFTQDQQKLEMINYGDYKLHIQQDLSSQYYAAVALSGPVSSREIYWLSAKLIDFAKNEMPKSVAVVNSTLTREVSNKLEGFFKDNVILQLE